jgi:hypothetical protein
MQALFHFPGTPAPPPQPNNRKSEKTPPFQTPTEFYILVRRNLRGQLKHFFLLTQCIISDNLPAGAIGNQTPDPAKKEKVYENLDFGSCPDDLLPRHRSSRRTFGHPRERRHRVFE